MRMLRCVCKMKMDANADAMKQNNTHSKWGGQVSCWDHPCNASWGPWHQHPSNTTAPNFKFLSVFECVSELNLHWLWSSVKAVWWIDRDEKQAEKHRQKEAQTETSKNRH